MYRENTKVIRIGDKVIGGGNPVLIQSMCNTKTEDVEATVDQILSWRPPAVTSSGWRCPPWRRLTPSAGSNGRSISLWWRISISITGLPLPLWKAVLIRSGSIRGTSAPGSGSRPWWIRRRSITSPSGWESTADPWRRSWWNGTEESRRRPWWRAQKGRSRSSRSWATITWW